MARPMFPSPIHPSWGVVEVTLEVELVIVLELLV